MRKSVRVCPAPSLRRYVVRDMARMDEFSWLSNR